MRALQVIHLIPSSPIFHLKTLNKFFQTLKQLLENSHISPTIEIAETHVSVHSSHHTPPGLLFGRFLMWMNKFSSFFANVQSLLLSTSFCYGRIFTKVRNIIGKGF